MKRRQFLTMASTATAMLATRGWATAKAQPLEILILGGTGFIGIHQTNLALARGHKVTHFNRGLTNPGLFPEVELLRGDRNGQLESLRDRKWDAVIDNSGFTPAQVRLSAELLAPHVQQYLFVSSLAVYPTFSTPRTEASPVAKLADENSQTRDLSTYGPLKAASEKVAERAVPGRVTVIRPGLIVGPGDYTGRFTYWPARAARGGDFLAPGTPRDWIQIIDARDLAAFALHALERHTTGTFNLVSPPGQFTMGNLIDKSITAAKALANPASPPRPVWVDAEFLETQQVGLFEIPVWVAAKGDMTAYSETSSARALEAGLNITPLHTTVHDTLEWHLQQPSEQRAKLRGGIAPEREDQILRAWHDAKKRAAVH